MHPCFHRTEQQDIRIHLQQQLLPINICASQHIEQLQSFHMFIDDKMVRKKVVLVQTCSASLFRYKLTTLCPLLPSAWSPWWLNRRSNNLQGWSELWWASLQRLHFLSYGCRSWRDEANLFVFNFQRSNSACCRWDKKALIQDMRRIYKKYKATSRQTDLQCRARLE